MMGWPVVLTRVAEIFVNKLPLPPSPAVHAESQAKRNLVFVHEALLRCHSAYLAYQSVPGESNRAAWQAAVLDLTRRIATTKTVLATFAQEAYDKVVGYTYPESVAVTEMDEDSLRRQRVASEFSIAFSGLQLLTLDGGPRWDEPFSSAATALRKAIAERLTPGEVQRAHDAYRREIAPGGWRRWWRRGSP
jgi:hypothetical protein